MRFKDQAICIRHLDWSETSQIVVLLTQTHGKVRGLAKGSKRTSPSATARFSGGIELLTQGQIVATTRPTAALASLTEWDLQDAYPHLRQSLHAQQLALVAADLCHAMLADEDPHPGIFAMMQTFLEALRHDKPQAALLAFQWGLLVDCGYRPQLEVDVQTGEPLSDADSYTFDPIGGGLTTQRSTTDWRVRRATVDLLRQWDQSQSLTGDDATIERGNRLLCVYFRSLLEKALPTMKIVLGAEGV